VLPLFAWLLPIEPRLERGPRSLGIRCSSFRRPRSLGCRAVIMERYYGSWQVMAASLKLLLLP